MLNRKFWVLFPYRQKLISHTFYNVSLEGIDVFTIGLRYSINICTSTKTQSWQLYLKCFLAVFVRREFWFRNLLFCIFTSYKKHYLSKTAANIYFCDEVTENSRFVSMLYAIDKVRTIYWHLLGLNPQPHTLSFGSHVCRLCC